jgi:hypothetical protein
VKQVIFNFTSHNINVKEFTFDSNPRVIELLPGFATQSLVFSKLEISAILKGLDDLNPIDHQVLIVMESQPAYIAAAFMVCAGMTQMNISCKIRIVNQGVYIPIDEWMIEGYDWAMQQSPMFREMEQMENSII